MSGAADRETSDYLEVVTRAYEMGKQQAYAELDRGMGQISAEHQERRWGEGGREHFGVPRPGDYQGGKVTWEPEEKEAGL